MAFSLQDDAQTKGRVREQEETGTAGSVFHSCFITSYLDVETPEAKRPKESEAKSEETETKTGTVVDDAQPAARKEAVTFGAKSNIVHKGIS